MVRKGVGLNSPAIRARTGRVGDAGRWEDGWGDDDERDTRGER